MGGIIDKGDSYEIDFSKIEDVPELMDAMNHVYDHMGARLEQFGIVSEDVSRLLDAFMNAGKNFAATYMRLLEAGKVPPEHRLEPSAEIKDMDIS